uniref:Olfactory receptor 69 n=1 Tax=Aulacocentrum confusum TaxID=2767324 RepID=A0A7G8Z988_9HYME|nr:olfactory receptor 69 [Aulacocentrum confusum]
MECKTGSMQVSESYPHHMYTDPIYRVLTIMTKFLPVSFFILQYIGLWQPVHWPIGWKTRVYTLFTMFSFTLLYVDTGSQILDCFQTATTISEYADHSFILLTMIGICLKMASLIKNRQSIIELINILQSGPFETQTQKEIQIRNSFENLMKWRTILFGIFVQMGTFNLFVTSLIYLAPHRITITRLYLPWDTKTFLGYWVAWILQCISRWFGGPVNVACDSLVSGLLYRAAAQFKILQLRLKDLATLGSNDNNINDTEELQTKKITDLVKQHLEIIQFRHSLLKDIIKFSVVKSSKLNSFLKNLFQDGF